MLVAGEVEGDVGGSKVIIAELDKVTGTIAAERFVRGQISGIIRGAMVTLQSTHRTLRATSITWRWRSSRALSSTAGADALATAPD